MKLKWAVCLAVLILAGCDKSEDAAPAQAPVAATPAPVPATASAEAKAGDAMQLHVPTVDGKGFDLAQHKGKWVVVNMWATWCGPCIEEMPELSALDAMREDVVVVGLDMEDISKPELNAFLQKHPVTYAIAPMDPAQPPAGFGSVEFLPKTWLIDPAGKLALIHPGPVTAQQLLKTVDAAKAKAP